jgi:hypothetical protein
VCYSVGSLIMDGRCAVTAHSPFAYLVAVSRFFGVLQGGVWICTTWISNSALCTWRSQTVYVQSQSGFLQSVRAAVEREELLYVMIPQKSVGAYSNMLDKTEEGNSYRLKLESRMNLQLRKFCKIDITSPANPTDCMDFVCRGSNQVMQLSK